MKPVKLVIALLLLLNLGSCDLIGDRDDMNPDMSIRAVDPPSRD